jgi:hypothetical protein
MVLGAAPSLAANLAMAGLCLQWLYGKMASTGKRSWTPEQQAGTIGSHPCSNDSEINIDIFFTSIQRTTTKDNNKGQQQRIQRKYIQVHILGFYF